MDFVTFVRSAVLARPIIATYGPLRRFISGVDCFNKSVTNIKYFFSVSQPDWFQDSNIEKKDFDTGLSAAFGKKGEKQFNKIF